MEDFTSPGSESRASTHALRQRARHEFRSFYTTASQDDAVLMDTLAVAHAALEETLATSRCRMPWPARFAFERMCNEMEQVFLEARDKVHHCFSFQRLSLADQTRIVVLVFDVRLHPV